jgi:hypothetical protein
MIHPNLTNPRINHPIPIPIRTGKLLPRTTDPEKSAAAAIFYKRYVTAREHPE